MAIFRSMEKQLNDVGRFIDEVVICHCVWNLGIGTGEFNFNDNRLSSELGVLSIPALCMISQGRVYHFENQDFTEANIKEFVRKSISMKRFIKEVKQILLALQKPLLRIFSYRLLTMSRQ